MLLVIGAGYGDHSRLHLLTASKARHKDARFLNTAVCQTQLSAKVSSLRREISSWPCNGSAV